MAQPPLRPEDLRDAVAEALAKQRAYEEARPTRLGRGAERVTRPLGGMLGRLIPPGLVQKGIDGADRLAGATLPRGVTGHDVTDIAACEDAALRVQGWAAGANAATGAASGWFGAAGMTADIPATIALAARNVRATGAAYGFTQDNAEERTFRLMVLDVATSHADANREERLTKLRDMAAWLNTPEGRLALEKGSEWLVEKVVERIARQLGVTLAGRGAGRLVPIAGSAVAAGINASFQTDVSRAARYAYRQRWIAARTMLPPPEGTMDAGGPQTTEEGSAP